MTPKEKAKELWWKFFHAQAKENEPYVADGEIACKCALIAVDEILGDIEDSILHPQNKEAIEYWQEVKQEIEKL